MNPCPSSNANKPHNRCVAGGVDVGWVFPDWLVMNRLQYCGSNSNTDDCLLNIPQECPLRLNPVDRCHFGDSHDRAKGARIVLNK